MIDALSERLDVTIEHRAGAAATHLMPDAMDIEPFGSCFFAATDLVAHNGIENLGAAAGDRAKTGFAQSLQGIADRHAKDPLSKMPHLNRGESFDMKTGIKGVQPTQKIEIPLFFQRRMQAADHMDFGNPKGQRFPDSADNFINRIF